MKGIKNPWEGGDNQSVPIWRYLWDDLASQFSQRMDKLADNGSAYRVAFVMESVGHFKSLQPARFFTFPQSSGDTKTLPEEINALTLRVSGGQGHRYLCQVSALNLHNSQWVSQVSVFV